VLQDGFLKVYLQPTSDHKSLSEHIHVHICISLFQFLCKVNKFHRTAAQILYTPSSATHIILYFKYIDSAKTTEQTSNSMKKHLSQEINNHSASVNFHALWNPKVHYYIQNSPPLTILCVKSTSLPFLHIKVTQAVSFLQVFWPILHLNFSFPFPAHLDFI
jgi:hypothetical protein